MVVGRLHFIRGHETEKNQRGAHRRSPFRPGGISSDSETLGGLKDPSRPIYVLIAVAGDHGLQRGLIDIHPQERAGSVGIHRSKTVSK